MKAVLFHIFDKDEFRQWPREFPSIDWAFAFSISELKREIVDADILLITNRASSPAVGEILRKDAEALKWIHFLTAGFDRGIAMGLPKGVRVSHSPGIRAPIVAEHALALLLALTRAIPEIAAAQSDHLLLREEISAKTSTLSGATVCIIGLGNVGREVCRRVAAFDSNLVAVSRTVRPISGIGSAFPREEMYIAISRADAVIICTSATEATRHLIAKGELEVMKRGSLLINVARGSIVDETALLDALRSGHLGGAALDVQETEPLPFDSPLWDMPHVIISPHSAGSGSSSYLAHRDLFTENLHRFQTGEPLKYEYQ